MCFFFFIIGLLAPMSADIPDIDEPDLPADMPGEVVGVAGTVAAVFGELGMPGVAAVCANAATEKVHAASTAISLFIKISLV